MDDGTPSGTPVGTDAQILFTKVGQPHRAADKVQTGADGHFVITGLDAVSYHLFVDYTGTGPWVDQWFPIPGMSPSFAWTTDPSGEGTASYNLQTGDQTGAVAYLESPAVVTGTVRLGTGGVLAGAGDVVISHRCQTNFATYNDSWTGAAPTAADGSYSISVGPSEYCTLRYHYQGTAGRFLDWYGRSDLDESLNSFGAYAKFGPFVKDVTMPVGRTIAGTVFLGSTGVHAGAGEVEVSVVDSLNPVATLSTVTDSDGRYSLSGLTSNQTPTFTYVGSGNFLWKTTPSNPFGSNSVDATLSTGYAVSGHVSLGQSCLSAGASVRVTVDDYPDRVVTTDSAGNYSLPGLPPGVRALRFEYLGPNSGFGEWWLGSVAGGVAAYPQYILPLPGTSVPDPRMNLTAPNPHADVTMGSINPLRRDLTCDAVSDILTRSPSGALQAYLGNGTGGISGTRQIGSGGFTPPGHGPIRQVVPNWIGYTAIVQAGDFDGDTHPDVMARDAKGGLTLFRGNGTGGWLGTKLIGSGWSSYTSMFSPGDFNFDGHPDLIARDSSGGLWLYPGNGTGGWKPRVRLGAGWQALTALFSPGDLDGDSWPDVIGRDAGGNLYLYSGGGTSFLSVRKIGSGFQSLTTMTSVGDFSGDGKSDVLGRTAAGDLYLYRGNGSGGLLPGVKIGSGFVGTVISN